MDSHAFDRLARTVSQSASRRRALGGLLGGVLATVAASGDAKHRHHRQGKANDTAKVSASDCAKFCTSLLPPGPQRGQCISDAAHGTGVCGQCRNNTSRLCCTPGTAGTMCDPSRPIACCASDQICQDGICVAACTPATQCPAGQQCGTAPDGCGSTINCGTCTGGQICAGNGVCVSSCDPSDNGGHCLCGGDQLAGSCAENHSGGPAFVCITDPAPCTTNNCADCAAAGRVCFASGSVCRDQRACGTPC